MKKRSVLDKRAQAAMEFLMTYGWAILIVLIILAALFFLGIFNPSAPNSCSISPPLNCKDVQIGNGGVSLILSANNIKEPAIVNRITVDDVACTNFQNGLNTISNNAETKITCLGIEPKSNNPKISFDVTYSLKSSGLSHDIKGTASAKKELFNLIQNSGFENNFERWYASGSFYSISTSTFYEGIKSLYLNYNGGQWAAASQCLGYNYYLKDKTYTANIKYKCSSGTGNARIFLGDDVNYGKWSSVKTKTCSGNWETLENSLLLQSDQPSNGRLCIYIYGQYSTSGVYYDNVELYTT